jgi:hypothetical protein
MFTTPGSELVMRLLDWLMRSSTVARKTVRTSEDHQLFSKLTVPGSSAARPLVLAVVEHEMAGVCAPVVDDRLLTQETLESADLVDLEEADPVLSMEML